MVVSNKSSVAADADTHICHAKRHVNRKEEREEKDEEQEQEEQEHEEERKKK